MFKRFLVLLVVAVICTRAGAQQNADLSLVFGDGGSRAYRVGTDITAAGSHVSSSTVGFGYQLARVSSSSIWLDLAQIFGRPGDLQASLPGSGKSTWEAYVAGVRLMVPVYKRLSPYAVTGVGGGLFHAVAVHDGSSPTVSTYRTFHGAFDFGGGVDFRLLRWFSLRAEVRDLVTGDQLGGAAGRQHVLPAFGIAFHL